MTSDILPIMGAVSSFVVQGMNLPFSWIFTVGAVSLSAGDICCIFIVAEEIYRFMDDILDAEDGGSQWITWSWK